jgi:O-antigen/teichoic acid export membrane protein
VLAPRVASGSTRIEDVRRYRAIVLGVMASGALVLTAAASTLIPALVGERFRGAVALLGIMALAETILASYVVDVHVMQGQGRFHAASLASTVCGPLIVLLDIVLIASNGPRGAAWATVIGYSAMAVIGHAMLRRGTTTGSPVRS